MSDLAVSAPAEAPARRKRPGMLRRLLRDKAAVAALIVLAIIVGAAILAPWIAPNDPYLTSRRRLLPPVWEARGSWQFILGTDSLGRCMLSRMLYGARSTFSSASSPPAWAAPSASWSGSSPPFIARSTAG